MQRAQLSICRHVTGYGCRVIRRTPSLLASTHSLRMARSMPRRDFGPEGAQGAEARRSPASEHLSIGGITPKRTPRKFSDDQSAGELLRFKWLYAGIDLDRRAKGAKMLVRALEV